MDKAEETGLSVVSKPNKPRRTVFMQTEMTGMMIERMLKIKNGDANNNSQQEIINKIIIPEESKINIQINSKEVIIISFYYNLHITKYFCFNILQLLIFK